MAKFTVEEVSPIERRIKVEVEPERVAAQLDRAYKTLSRQVKVPGFRPGKVPRRILEARFRPQVEGEAMQSLVQESLVEAVEAHPDLQPVGAPRVNTEELKPGEPFRYQAHVEVAPKIEPKDYEGLELKKAKVEVTDAVVDAELDRLRNAMQQLVAVEGRDVAEKGDFAIVHYEGTIDGKPFAGGTASDVPMEIAPGGFDEGNIEALAGAKVGESREVQHSFPADYRLAELKGKTATFRVTLDGLKQRKLPELDDAFAKETGAGVNTLAELKDRIRKDLTARDTEKSERGFRDELFKALIAKNPFDLPKSMVDRHVDRMLESNLNRFMRQGIDPRQLQLDFDRLRESMRPAAEQEVRGTLILEAIAEKEKIEVKPEDLDARVKRFAEEMKAPEEKVRAQFASVEGGLSVLAPQVREEKTLAFLESKAKISQP